MPPYTQTQWLGLAPEKRGFKNYNRYLSWWNQKVGPKMAQRSTSRFGLPVNPLDPIDPNKLFGMAQSQIDAQINPIIDHYLKALDARAQTSMQRLRGATQDFVGDVGGMAKTIGDTYDTSIRGVQNTNQGIVDFLQRTGQNVAGEAQKGLEAINAPQANIDANAGTLASLGTGITGGALGRGSIEENRLYSDRAADTTEAALYPKHAAEYGFNAAYDLESALSGEREQGLSDIRSQIPGMVQDTFQQLLDREMQKAIAREGFAIDRAGSSGGGSGGRGVGLSNTPGGTLLYDKDTGQYQFVPGTKPAPKSKSTKLNETGFGMATKSATDLHDTMMKKFQPNPITGEGLSKQQRASIVAANRKEATRRVYGTLYTYYPGKSNEWYHQKASEILTASGWPGAAQAILGGTITPPSGKGGQATGTGRNPTPTPQRARTAQKPTRTTPRPSSPAGDRGGPANANRSGTPTTAQRQAEAQRRRNVAAQQIESRAQTWKSQGMDRNKAEQLVFQSLTKVMKGVPSNTIRARARQITQRVYGS